MGSFVYIELSSAKIKPEVLQKYNCGHFDFNEFLAHDAIRNSENGEGVTYILVSNDEYMSGNITTILAFATLQTMALFVSRNSKTYSIPSVEIKYFSIAKKYQKATIYVNGQYKSYSSLFFEQLLVDLYQMSIRLVGFQAIFLRANQNGENLYRRKFFIDTDQYIVPYSEDDPLETCVPLVLFIQDNLHSIFGEEKALG